MLSYIFWFWAALDLADSSLILRELLFFADYSLYGEKAVKSLLWPEAFMKSCDWLALTSLFWSGSDYFICC